MTKVQTALCIWLLVCAVIAFVWVGVETIIEVITDTYDYKDGDE